MTEPALVSAIPHVGLPAPERPRCRRHVTKCPTSPEVVTVPGMQLAEAAAGHGVGEHNG